MARTTKKKETATPVVTRAEKKDAVKNVIREILAVKPYKHNELLDEAARLYTARFGGEDTENVNDVKGRVGSVLDIMKKESDVAYEGGVYALKARLPMPPTETKTEEKPKKTRAKKQAKTEETPAPVAAEAPEKTPKKATKKKAVKVEEKSADETPVTEEKPAKKPKKTRAKKAVKEDIPTPAEAEEKTEQVDEKTTPKKRGRKTKAKTEEAPAPVAAVESKQESVAEEKPVEVAKPQAEEAPAPVEEKPTEAQAEEKGALVVKEKGEIAKKEVMDVTFLLGAKPAKEEPKKPETPQEKPVEKQEQLVTKQEKPAPVAEKPQAQPAKQEQPKKPTVAKSVPIKPKQPQRQAEKPLTADEKLREAYLKRLRSLGGDYFEYYSVYLLERYCMKNGRRLEGMRISGGDHDGGIDGEIELTDRFGFKETIYIQSKNWNPEKGDEKLWVVGETLLQQFLGACACRQAKDGKQSCRGIFVTTSRFTPEAKRILETMADKLVGYDGNDLYEAAKECAFGLVKKNGEWALDERLLSGAKAFFNML